MGARLAGSAGGPGPARRPSGISTSTAVERRRRRARRSCSGSTTPATRPARSTGAERDGRRRRLGARARGIVVASDECYAEFTGDADGRPPTPATVLHAGSRRRARGALAVEALEHGRAAGRASSPATRELVQLPRRGPQARRAHGRRRRCRPRRPRRSATTSTSTSSAPATRERRALVLDALARARARPRRRAVDVLPVAARRRAARRRLGDRGAVSPRPARSSRPATSTARPAPTTSGSSLSSR